MRRADPMGPRHWPIVLVLTLIAAGCSSPSGTDEPAAEPPRDSTPVTPLGFAASSTLGGATNGAEPQVLVAPDGDIFVHTPLQLWRSRDGGASFAALGDDDCDAPQGIGLPACAGGEVRKNPGLVGPNDGALVALPDGTLLWAGLLGGGFVVPFQISTDDGDSWSDPVELAEGNGDREWLHARGDGFVLVVWRENNARVASRVSYDNGTTWEAIVDVGPVALLGPPVELPDHTLILPMYAARNEEGARVARSTDDGATWSVVSITDIKTNAPARNGGPIFALPVVAVDDAGILYLAWSSSPGQAQTFGVKATDVPSVQLARSLDGGLSWSEPRTVSDPTKSAILPWIVAGAKGRLALAWYENERGLPSETVPDAWRVRVSTLRGADEDEPVIESIFASASVAHLGGHCTDGAACLGVRERSLLDFLGLALTKEDHLLVAYAGNDGVPRGPIHVTVARSSAAVSLR